MTNLIYLTLEKYMYLCLYLYLSDCSGDKWVLPPAWEVKTAFQWVARSSTGGTQTNSSLSLELNALFHLISSAILISNLQLFQHQQNSSALKKKINCNKMCSSAWSQAVARLLWSNVWHLHSALEVPATTPCSARQVTLFQNIVPTVQKNFLSNKRGCILQKPFLVWKWLVCVE